MTFNPEYETKERLQQLNYRNSPDDVNHWLIINIVKYLDDSPESTFSKLTLELTKLELNDR